jgi:hypothetical protein
VCRGLPALSTRMCLVGRITPARADRCRNLDLAFEILLTHRLTAVSHSTRGASPHKSSKL